MSTRDAFDAVFADKKAAIAREAAPEVVEPSQEEPTAPQSTEKIEDRLQEKAEAKAQAKSDLPAEVPSELAARLERTVPPKVRNILKVLTDPETGGPVDSKTRKEIADTYFVGRAYRDTGMPLAAVPAYLEIAPTVDVLKQINGEAKVGREMLSDFNSANPEDNFRFATRLSKTNPEALKGLVSIVTDPGWLEKAVPDSFTSVGQAALTNLYRNAKREAAKTGNAELEAAFDIVAEYSGITLEPRPSAEPAEQEPALDPVRAELEELKGRERAIYEQQVQQFHQSTYEQAATTVMSEVNKVIEQSDPDGVFNETTRQRMANEIGRRIYETVQANQAIATRYEQLLKNGDGSAQHKAMVAKFLVDQGLGLLSRHAGDVLAEYGSMFEHVFNQREQKQDRILSRREPVAAGGRPALPTEQAPNLKGVGMKDAFDVFFAHRLKR